MVRLGTKGKYGREVGMGEIREARKGYPKKEKAQLLSQGAYNLILLLLLELQTPEVIVESYGYRIFSYIPCPHTFINFPTINILYHHGTFVTIHEV